MKKLALVLIILLSSSCVIKKEISITVYDSDGVELDIFMQGSDLDDIKPELKVPLLP